MTRSSLVLALSFLLATSVARAQTPITIRPVPILQQRAMVYPDDATEWGYLTGSEIQILVHFGVSAEVAATQAKLNQLRSLGVTLHQLPKVDTLYYRLATVDPTAAPIQPATHPQITAFPGESHPLVASMDGVWQAPWTAQLQGIGAQIVGAMPPYGALLHVPIGQLGALESLPFVRGVRYLDPELRLAPRLGTSVPSASFLAEVLIFEGFSPTRVQTAMGGAPVTTIAGRSILTGWVNVATALALAQFPEVEWIDDWDPGNTYNEKMRVLVQTEHVHPSGNQAFHNPIYAMGVDGSTETIAICDTGIRTDHEAFLAPGKIPPGLHYVPTGSPGTLGDENGHGSSAACSAAGDVFGPLTPPPGYGTANKYDGLAFNAKLLIQDIGNVNDPVALPDDWITEVMGRAYAEGARIQNTSWGHGNSEINFNGGTYSFRTQIFDRFLKDPSHADSVQTVAVGNYGAVYPPAAPTYQPNSISDEAHAKNVISVGGHRNGSERNVMYTWSGRGPTNDGILTGRVKPDILSVGINLMSADSWSPTAYFLWPGTSSSSPCIAGAAALIRDWFNKQLYTGPALLGEPSSALIKAMLVNSTAYQADPTGFLGNAAAGLPPDGYPNFDQGYGRPRLDGVLDPNGYRTVKLFQNATTAVQTGDRWTRIVNLQNEWPGSACNSLRVTLAWTDEPMSLPSGKALVNDLDLQVTFLDTKYIGNDRHMQDGKFDGMNNVEDILIPIMDGMTVPLTFTIQVDVLGTQVFSDIDQPFAVVVTYGSCPGTLPCGALPGCYAGPGDIVPTSIPPPNPCDQEYSLEEFLGGDPQPHCGPGGPGVDPVDPVGPIEPGEPINP